MGQKQLNTQLLYLAPNLVAKSGGFISNRLLAPMFAKVFYHSFMVGNVFGRNEVFKKFLLKVRD